jgi:hypothetical protein
MPTTSKNPKATAPSNTPVIATRTQDSVSGNPAREFCFSEFMVDGAFQRDAPSRVARSWTDLSLNRLLGSVEAGQFETQNPKKVKVGLIAPLHPANARQ